PPRGLQPPGKPDRRGSRGGRGASLRSAQRRPLVVDVDFRKPPAGAARVPPAGRRLRERAGVAGARERRGCAGSGRQARRARLLGRRRGRGAAPRRGGRRDRSGRRARRGLPRRRSGARARGGGALRGAARGDAVIVLAPEVEAALRDGAPVVALETTLVAHGFPAGDGVAVGLESERRVRDAHAVPATIGVLDGAVRVGLHAAELERFDANARKVGPRDLAARVVQSAVGGTTGGGTLAVCRAARIRLMGTGGPGGAHRGW